MGSAAFPFSISKFFQKVISLNCTIIFIPQQILSSPTSLSHIPPLQVLWNSSALFHVLTPFTVPSRDNGPLAYPATKTINVNDLVATF